MGYKWKNINIELLDKSIDLKSTSYYLIAWLNNYTEDFITEMNKLVKKELNTNRNLVSFSLSQFNFTIDFYDNPVYCFNIKKSLLDLLENFENKKCEIKKNILDIIEKIKSGQTKEDIENKIGKIIEYVKKKQCISYPNNLKIKRIRRKACMNLYICYYNTVIIDKSFSYFDTGIKLNKIYHEISHKLSHKIVFNLLNKFGYEFDQAEKEIGEKDFNLIIDTLIEEDRDEILENINDYNKLSKRNKEKIDAYVVCKKLLGEE